MLATREQRHAAQPGAADHARSGVRGTHDDSRERSIGLEEVLAMRVGCWSPPVYVPVPALAP